jgi:hypothetical protein
VLVQASSPVTVASVFVDFRKGISQDVRHGNAMFLEVQLPADDDPLSSII